MRAPAALLAALCACGPARQPAAPGGLTRHENLPRHHVASCLDASQCGSGVEPPAGGPHCGSWLPCRVYATAQNRCEWLHNLEHGHLVMAYHCPSGCDEVVQALSAFQAGTRRSLVTPDPRLTTKVAAMVWGYSWASDAVDVSKLEALRALQDSEAPEPGLGCSP